MYPQTPSGFAGQMPYGQATPGRQGGELDEYYEALPPQWSCVETSPYLAMNHPNSTTAAAYPSAAILTPISLPDSSFIHARPSPVVSHRSQEYQYNISETVPQHGLGITAPFPSNFPRTVTAGLGHAIDQYDFGHAEATVSPHQPPAKRVRRGSLKAPSSSRETPVSILPHPEGLQRLEQERRQGHIDLHPHHRSRAPGRGRRDPQAEEEDAFVEGLREQNLAWKVIREMFREKFNKDASEARLQMRMLRRRKERLARWDENDIPLLIRARDHWEREKYHFIAQKMRDLGARRTYTPQQCEAQLKDMEAESRERADASLSQMTERSRTRKRVRANSDTGPYLC
ncbi:hypothetical protein CNMCM8980_009008 [Aspergillus fumigatiaffinis]|uniref:Myb-like domain-containing protein n=1 Tax=Aspergillus fumigatiaffinis TaxID=340414 RepID=A0A8H4M0Q6_9EURO|nr:hypothetical protein CNMCM5878_004794 [Aspergillus fumigatiaffinis]KAF4224889.1 hypothetical protein CNMCM6457_008848 [Aspergillus fumigatiaffinis]KAF4244671.1 hypothetical protein CNMCM6805_008069 [Aspergillus fumigatiaffinis]KAF4251087.1 hypothetical protein CNMCM8980_009008 [Aspergillus fumigatiaffinis]